MAPRSEEVEKPLLSGRAPEGRWAQRPRRTRGQLAPRAFRIRGSLALEQGGDLFLCPGHLGVYNVIRAPYRITTSTSACSVWPNGELTHPSCLGGAKPNDFSALHAAGRTFPTLP